MKTVRTIVFIVLFPLLLFSSSIVFRTMDSTFVVNSYNDGDNIYIGVKDFTRLLNGKLLYDVDRDEYIVKKENLHMKILPESPYYLLNGKIEKFGVTF